jgi:DNA integrity scanning protein DisA with diadenylate cyclase activity
VVIFLSAASMMTLNTGIVMILMLVEIKSIFNAEILKDLSEKKTRQIMLAGLIIGIVVDLPVEISWFVYDF